MFSDIRMDSKKLTPLTYRKRSRRGLDDQNILVHLHPQIDSESSQAIDGMVLVSARYSCTCHPGETNMLQTEVMVLRRSTSSLSIPRNEEVLRVINGVWTTCNISGDPMRCLVSSIFCEVGFKILSVIFRKTLEIFEISCS